MLNFIHRLFTRKVTTAVLFLSVFGLTAGTAFFIVPQAAITEREKAGPAIDDPVYEMTGRERFIGNLASSASSGLSIDVDELRFAIDGKEETYEDELGLHTVQHTNVIDASGTTIDFAMSSLSLHGINLALTAPISYSDAGNREHKRGVHASMIDGTIYLNLYDLDEANSWDFKYKVSVRERDILDNQGNPITDPVTGGITRYEYGDLDYLIEDVFSILSEGGIDLSLEGWLDKLTGGEETTSEEPQEEQSSGISTDAIMDSMSEMVETTHEGNPYFIWKLPLGSKTIELGMRSDENYMFTGVDLPALYDYDREETDSGVVYTPKANDDLAWEIQEGMSLVAHATIRDFGIARGEWTSSLIPGDVAEYRDLMNSRYMLESIARYVANPQFGVEATIDLGYESEAKGGDRTHVAKDAKSDSIRIALSADADLSERKFHGAQGQLSLQKIDHVEQEEVIKARHDVNVAYLYDQQTAEGDAFLDINGDLFKAHTTKTYLDEFYSEVLQGAFSSGDTQEEAEGENTLNQVREVLNKVGLSIDAILDSDLLTDIHNGVYLAALDIIESFRSVQYEDGKGNKTGDSALEVVLTLAPLGLEGKIVLTLNGTENNANLLNLELQNIRFAMFTLNGRIATRAFAPLTDKESYEGYDDLEHLKGIGEQVTDIVNEKSFSANLGVTLTSEKDNEPVTDLALNGGLAFAFDEDLKGGKIDLNLEQNLTDMIVKNHKVDVDLRDGFETVAFAYGSSANEITALPEEALKAKLSFNSLTETLGGVLDNVMNLDDRFSRLSASLTKEAGTSLLSRITKGEYSALLEKTDILSRADLHDENGNTVIVVNHAALGMDEDIVVTVHYLEGEEGGIDYLSVEMGVGEKDLAITLGGIDSIELRDTEGELKPEAPELFASFSEEEVESFKDVSFVGEVLDYAVGTLTLGTVADEDGEVSGVSHYGLQGDLSVKIGNHDLTLGLFDAYASVEGAETKIYANLEGLPVIRGVNGPDSSVYFRPNEAEGVRDAAIYYYANGINPKGEALLTRDSSYGKVRNVRDGVRLNGEDFTGDLLGWLGRYSLGILDSILDKDEEPSTTPAAPGRKMRAGLLGDEGIRIETVINGFNKSTLNGADRYTISVDLGKLLGIAILGNADITLTGRTLHNGENTFKTLTAINVHADASAKAANTGNAMHLVSVDVDLFLNNIKKNLQDDYVMEDVWGEGYPTADFAANFIGEVADDGTITGKGLLYDLPNGFSNAEGKETQLYGYDFREAENLKAGNLYLGL